MAKGEEFRDDNEEEEAEDWLTALKSAPDQDYLQALINRDLQAKIHAMLNTLTKEEETILRMRFGLGDESPHTLQEVAQVFNRTREEIRQMEAQALRKLKHPNRSNILRSFMSDEEGRPLE
jgi:RNA polymerase sigma factor (sigma-70 family)